MTGYLEVFRVDAHRSPYSMRVFVPLPRGYILPIFKFSYNFTPPIGSVLLCCRLYHCRRGRFIHPRICHTPAYRSLWEMGL